MTMVENGQTSTLERTLSTVNERFDKQLSKAKTTSQIRHIEKERSHARSEVYSSHGRSYYGGMIE